MSKIDRYIGVTVLLAIALVFLVLLGLDFIFTLFEEIGDTGEGYGFGDAVLYVIMIIPRHIYEFLPIIALIGSLAGLGVLASSNELVVMQAAGVEAGRIVWAVMKPALAIMLFGLLLGEYVAPELQLRAEVRKAVAGGQEVMLSRYGYWQRAGNQYMHFNAIEPEGILHGVTIYRFNDERQPVANTFAERAVYQESGSGDYWMLENVEETLFHREEGEVRSSNRKMEQKTWEVDLTPELLQILIIEPEKMGISDLFRYARRFESQGQDADRYYLSFWAKVFQPLTTAVLVLVAISFIFGPLREATMGYRLFVSICFGLLFWIVQRLFHTISLVYQFEPLVAVLFPILLCGAIGVHLMRRAV